MDIRPAVKKLLHAGVFFKLREKIKQIEKRNLTFENGEEIIDKIYTFAQFIPKEVVIIPTVKLENMERKRFNKENLFYFLYIEGFNGEEALFALEKDSVRLLIPDYFKQKIVRKYKELSKDEKEIIILYFHREFLEALTEEVI